MLSSFKTSKFEALKLLLERFVYSRNNNKKRKIR